MRIPGFIRRRLLRLALRHYSKRPADFVIAPHGSPYLRRWYVLPRNRWFNVYLHQFLRSDDDRALHDHPWWNCSVLLAGEYTEVTFSDALACELGGFERVRNTAGDVKFRAARTAHRLELPDFGSCWTLFITGPISRTWGFWVGGRWVRHDQYAEVIEGVSSIKEPTIDCGGDQP